MPLHFSIPKLDANLGARKNSGGTQFGTTCLGKHKLTKLKRYKDEFSESSAAALPTCLTLAHFIVLLFPVLQTAKNTSHAII